MLPVLDHDSPTPLYIQLYDHIRKAVLDGSLSAGEKLPSLRGFSKNLAVSLTTVELAYSQLQVEGYIGSRPQSGYFVNNIAAVRPSSYEYNGNENHHSVSVLDDVPVEKYYSDLNSFDFIKWKKCMNKILNDYPALLLEEGLPQGEEILRVQISRYIYQSRGVNCSPDQIVIGAGTQQITGLLSVILGMMDIEYAAFEDPGYRPVRSAFIDKGFGIIPISVSKDGIRIEDLPGGIPCAVYVSPSNQFPMGFVMPVARRYALLEWADKNGSIIIEDDYDSELRYFGRPVPALQGLGKSENVVYLGSFSSTLFPAIKISYMVLPAAMLRLFRKIQGDYTQTCSKAEQLTLALYMQNGMYQANIKRLRKLNSQKVHAATDAINKHMGGFVKILNNSSGVQMLLEFSGKKSPEQLCREAAALGIQIVPVARFTFQKLLKENIALIFYYTRIPLADIDPAIKRLSALWDAP